MARIARRITGSHAVEVEHPLRLWQREVFSPGSVAQARLLLVDIAVERGRAGEADLTTSGDREPHDGSGLKQSIGRWRLVAAGVAIGDAGSLIAFARGLAGERSERRLGDDSLDAAFRGWSSAHPGWTVEQLVQLGTANPLLVIDEIDKAGGSDRNGRASMSLLTLLERRTSRTYHDECLGGPIDLSGISWICTANSTTGLPGPLLSRLIVAVVPAPDADQVGVLLDTMREEIAAERGIKDPRMLPILPQSAVELLRQGYAAHGDPRRLRAELVRILATAARAEELWTACPDANLH